MVYFGDDLIKEYKVEIKDVFNAFKTILIENTPMLRYAAAYALTGLRIEDVESLRIHCMYVLSNIVRWKGTKAQAVKIILRRFIKENKP